MYRSDIIHIYQNNVWNLNSKYHTTTDHTKRHMKIQTIKKSISLVCVPKNPSPGATCRVMQKKIWILMHSVEGKSYQGTTQRDTVKGLLSRIYITVLYVAKELYPETTHRDTWGLLLDRINISMWLQNTKVRIQ